jgi:hypothetical protein
MMMQITITTKTRAAAAARVIGEGSRAIGE